MRRRKDRKLILSAVEVPEGAAGDGGGGRLGMELGPSRRWRFIRTANQFTVVLAI